MGAWRHRMPDRFDDHLDSIRWRHYAETRPMFTVGCGRSIAARRRCSRQAILAAALLLMVTTAVSADGPPDATIFRIFLTNGTAVASYGEFARVGDRVVFSMPLGVLTAHPQLHLVNLPAGLVDWPTTEEYANAARYARFVATRAESDFAELSGQIAEALNTIVLTNDPARRLEIAEQARRRLVDWPKEHYGYRAADVIQIAGLLDEAISELRAAAGVTAFDLSLVAEAAPPTVDQLLSLPSPKDTIDHAAMVAGLTDVPAERLSLLQSIAASLSGSPGTYPEAWAGTMQKTVRAAIAREIKVSKDYAQLSNVTMLKASNYARKADVAGVERVRAQVSRIDARLGRQRPEEIAALLQAIHERLDAARRLRLARDQWVSRIASYRRYRGLVKEPIGRLAGIRRRLEAIRELAGPSASALPELATILARTRLELSRIDAPTELKPTHALLLSAVGLADSAVTGRRDAVESGDLRTAWDASAAAAGSMMLLARARTDVESALKLPQLR